VTLLLNLRKGSTEEELRQFFDTLHEQPLAPSPTRQALWKSRRQLAPQVFVALNQGVVEQFRRDFTPKLYWGFRLLAVDGTTLRLPSSRKIEQAFGAATDGPPLARVSLLYDIAQDLVIDTQMAALCVSERGLAIEHLAQMGPGDLAIYDRGYPAFWLMALHRAQGSDWCMRLSRGSFAAAEPFWNSAEHSTVITLTPSAEQRRHCRDQAVSAEPLRIRLVRVRLKGGETEVLATSVLDTERLPNRAFGALYHKRWNVGEGIKRQKRRAEIENFSGRSPLVIAQDVHAKILALNLAAMVRLVADVVARRHFAHRRDPQQIRWTNTLSDMKNNLVRLLLHAPADVADLWRRLVHSMAIAVDAIRPDRSYPRPNPGKLKPGFHPQYKRTA
jgi:hypothetical protein